MILVILRLDEIERDFENFASIRDILRHLKSALNRNETTIKEELPCKLTFRDRLYTRIIYLYQYEFVSANHEALRHVVKIKDKIITL